MSKSIDEMIQELIEQLPSADRQESARIRTRIKELEELQSKRAT